jgi:hypothetical protein
MATRSIDTKSIPAFPRAPRWGLIASSVLATVIGLGATAAAGPGDRPPPVGALPGPLVGTIEISNERARPVAIYLDGRFALEVRPRSTQLIDSVPNGVRLVSYSGAHERDWQTDRVEVRENRRSALRIAPLRPTTATLVVSNPFDRKVTVLVDGRRVTELRRLESERIEGLRPGRAHVELRHGRHALADDSVELVAGRESYFAPQLQRPGALELKNPTNSPVRITLLERPGGARLPDHLARDGFRLEPGSARVVNDLGAGPLTVQVTTEDGRIIKHEADIVAGRTSRFDVPYAWIGPHEPGPRPREY